MSAVKGTREVVNRLKYIQKEGIVTVQRWLLKWGNEYAVHEQRQFHKGQPGWWTGTFARSIGCSGIQQVGKMLFVSIGPGQHDNAKLKIGASSMFGSGLIQAYSLEKGAPYKAHFVSFKNNPMFELWASQHGFKTRNKKGQPSGGLRVGGKPDSILQRGIHYKQSADAVVIPKISASREMLKNELTRLADKARAVR